MGLRLPVAVAAILFLSGAAHAGLADVLTAAINKCAAITDAPTRHACYDQLPTLLKAPVAAAEAPASVVAPASPPPAAAQPPVAANAWASEEKRAVDESENSLAPEPMPADYIAATVDSFTFDYGVFVVTLDNGQVWREASPSKSLVPLSRENKAQVLIWHSRFGYYVLKIRGYHPTYRVRRIK